jgi:tetratricopeptide (TPR) repeat protein
VTTPTPKNKSQNSLWNYALTVIVSAAMGAGLTWMFTSQSSRPEIRPISSAPASAPLSNAAPDVSGMPAGDAAVTRGNLAYDRQQWTEAIRNYQEAIASGVDNADVHTDLGNAFRFSGQPEQALNQYTIAQKINPQHENSLFNQISLFTELLNQPERAVPICNEFLRRFPHSDKVPAVQQQLARIKGQP